MKWLLWFVLLAALMAFVYLMFILYRYDRKNKLTKIPQKDLLLGYDSISKASWSSSSMTNRTGENRLKVVGESPDQDALEKIFRPRTDEGAGKKSVVTILVEDDNPEELPRHEIKGGGVAK